MFVKLNEKKEILASANFKVDETFIETDKEVIRGFDGKLYFKDEEPKKPLELLKKEKLQELKQARDKFKKTIFIKEGISLYDIENLQDSPYLLISLLLGIGEFTSEDLELYKSKISSIAKIYDTTKKLIENCNLKSLLDKININFIKE